MKLIMEDFRCFAGRHEVEIRPLTLLVGENSSGKTSFLGALSVVTQPGARFPFAPAFNEPPYSLGSFDTMATYAGGKAGRAKSIMLGVARRVGQDRAVAQLEARYRSREGRVDVTEVVVSEGRLRIDILGLGQQDKPGSLRITWGTDTHEVELPEPFRHFGMGFHLADALYAVAWRSTREKAEDEPWAEAVRGLTRSTRLLSSGGVLSLAPVRTRPRRTYDEPSEEYSPEGEHVPFVLLQRLQDQRFLTALNRFGVAAGLFKKLTVKRWGERPGAPVQVLVHGEGRPANLIDVGYGVSQVLPVVVQSILGRSERTLLVQQPEVHLHPRAQAALGSFFVDLVSADRREFVVETHSDFIVDRVRQEIASGRIAKDQVQLLFFEKRGYEAHFYPIEMDAAGNITDAPPSYREFFLREEMNLLQRGRATKR